MDDIHKKIIFLVFFILTTVIIFLQISGTNAESLYIKAQKHYINDFDKSVMYFKESILLDPMFEKSYLMLFHYYYIIERNFEDALKTINGYVNITSNKEIGFSLRSFIYIEQDHLDLIESDLNNIENEPYDFTYLAKGIYYYKTDNFEKGDEMFERAMTTKKLLILEEPDPFFRIEKIDKILTTLIEHEQYDKCKKLIQDILNNKLEFNVYPLEQGTPLTLFHHLAKIHMELGEYDEAEKILLDLETNFEEERGFGLDCPYQALGLLYFQTENYDKSSEYYEKYANITPYRIQSQLEAAQACFKAGKHSCAIDYLEKVLDKDPNNKEAIQLLNKLNSSLT